MMRMKMVAAVALLVGGAGATLFANSGNALPLQLANPTSAQTGTQGALLEEVAQRRWRRDRRGVNRNWRYDRRRHGARYRYPRGGYRHYYGGYYYRNPWWHGTHKQWCLDHYESYTPQGDSFLGFDGYYHRCISPYS